MLMNMKCCKSGCEEVLHGLNSKACKLCEQQVCLKHLQPENHDCPKVIYTKYIRKTWLRKYGQNVTTATFIVVCETCGYVSELSSLIEYAGAELETHLKNNENCMLNKRTFLEELFIDQ